MYARESLEHAGIWDDVRVRLRPAMDVRAALAYVQKKEAEAGIVYRTDAGVVDGVKVIYEIPSDFHKPIVYQAAVVAGGNLEEAGTLLEFLRGPKGLKIFLENGFNPPGE